MNKIMDNFGVFDYAETPEGTYEYSAAEMRSYFAAIVGNGVLKGAAGQFAASAVGLTITLATGEGWLLGVHGAIVNPVDFTVDPVVSGMSRICSIVMDVDIINQLMGITVLVGTQAASPSDPVLTQSDVRYQQLLHKARVYDNGTVVLTDCRTFIKRPGEAATPVEIGALPYDAIPSSLLNNGYFDIWQDGVSFLNPVNSKYLADCWLTAPNTADGGTLPNITVSRQTFPGAGYPNRNFLRVAYGGAGSNLGANSFYAIRQKIENGTMLYAGSGNKITVSFMAYSDIPNKRIGIRLVQRYGTGGSPSATEVIGGAVFTLTNATAVYTHTFTLNTKAGKTFGTNNDDTIDVDFVHAWGASIASSIGASTAETFVGAGYVDTIWAHANAGDAKLPPVPKPFGIELALCQPHYEKSYNLSAAPGSITLSGAESIVASSGYLLAVQVCKFKTRKRISPTMSIYAPSNGASGYASEYNLAGTFVANRAVSVIWSSETEFFIQSQNSDFTVGNQIRFHWTSDARMY